MCQQHKHVTNHPSELTLCIMAVTDDHCLDTQCPYNRWQTELKGFALTGQRRCIGKATVALYAFCPATEAWKDSMLLSKL